MNNTSNNFFGFTPFAEAWSGRLAMVGLYLAVVIELVTGKGLLHFWGVM